MISVTIKMRPGMDDYKFTWEGSSDEACALSDECEALAGRAGYDARTFALSTIQHVHDHGMPADEVGQRGFRAFATYAVLRFMDDELPGNLVDGAGKPATVFDCAEHQCVIADVRLEGPGKLTVQLTGRPTLDS